MNPRNPPSNGRTLSPGGNISCQRRSAALPVVRLLLILCFAGQVATAAAGALSIAFHYSHLDVEIRQLFQDFSRQSGIEVNVAALGNEELKSQLVGSTDGTGFPDAIIAPADYLGLVNGRYSEVPEAWLANPLLPEFRDQATIDGKLLGIPLFGGNHLLLYYNKRQIAQPAATWEQVFRQHAASADKRRFMAWHYNTMYFFIPFIGAHGKLPFEQGGLNLESPSMAEALRFYGSLARRGLVSERCTYDCVFDGFASGDFGYVIDGTWAYSQYKRYLGKDLGVALLPDIGDKIMRPYYSAYVLMFPDHSLQSSNREALLTFSRYLQSAAVQEYFWQHFTGTPVHRQAFDRLSRQADADARVILEQLRRAAPMPHRAQMAYVWEVILKGFNRYSAGLMDEYEASQWMQHLAERSIQGAGL